MKIDFNPVKTYSKVLVGETISPNKKVVDRFYVWEKQSRNPYNEKIMVMRQTINETKKGWLVTDMEVFDSKTGKAVKTLKREVDDEGNFVTHLKFIDKKGKKQTKSISHEAK